MYNIIGGATLQRQVYAYRALERCYGRR